jgi:hypothetical protein
MANIGSLVHLNVVHIGLQRFIFLVLNHFQKKESKFNKIFLNVLKKLGVLLSQSVARRCSPLCELLLGVVAAELTLPAVARLLWQYIGVGVKRT